MQSIQEIDESGFVEEELKVLFKMTFNFEAELESVISSQEL